MTPARQAVRTYLEMTSPSDADAPPAPEADAALERAGACAPALWRGLYAEVGREHHWIDRLPWTDQQIEDYLADPAIELWLLRAGGEVAGYFELRRDKDGGVEIAYLGLLPAFIGRGLGRFMLASAIERAWALEPTRVWVHTSSLDHASALPNYLARGFRLWKQEVYAV
jgi:ribosomal protein S18 acetylase RimI-like enzyme